MSTPTNSRGFVFYGDSAQATKQTVQTVRTGLIIGAIITAIVGILMLSFPAKTAFLAGIIFGIFVLIRGIVRVVVGIGGPGLTGLGRTLSIVLGVVLLVAGVFILLDINLGIEVLAIVIGISWIIDGIATLIESSHAAARAFSIVTGIVSVLAGIAMFFLGTLGVELIMVIIGAIAIALAIVQVIGAIVVGRSTR
ncbi:MAG: hypothetical protein F2808_03395 [Actinobacteria bacterium]|uniref:Unannotated protein n=1 Tax=freshwater metagenome TaxID=449393 RepID=A0A6J7FPF7_9ZZZZ|nr:hypothetical protein [Actinomycetota bacterium]